MRCFCCRAASCAPYSLHRHRCGLGISPFCSADPRIIERRHGSQDEPERRTTGGMVLAKFVELKEIALYSPHSTNASIHSFCAECVCCTVQAEASRRDTSKAEAARTQVCPFQSLVRLSYRTVMFLQALVRISLCVASQWIFTYLLKCCPTCCTGTSGSSHKSCASCSVFP